MWTYVLVLLRIRGFYIRFILCDTAAAAAVVAKANIDLGNIGNISFVALLLLLLLTLFQIRNDVAVHGQAKRVACLRRELLHILGPLPAVPVRAEEELLVAHRIHRANTRTNERTKERTAGSAKQGW